MSDVRDKESRWLNGEARTATWRGAASCPVSGLVTVRFLELDGLYYAWCQRSYLVCEVPYPSPDCPFKHSPHPIPDVARWLCPLHGEPAGWPALVGRV